VFCSQVCSFIEINRCELVCASRLFRIVSSCRSYKYLRVCNLTGVSEAAYGLGQAMAGEVDRHMS